MSNNDAGSDGAADAAPKDDRLTIASLSQDEACETVTKAWSETNTDELLLAAACNVSGKDQYVRTEGEAAEKKAACDADVVQCLKHNVIPKMCADLVPSVKTCNATVADLKTCFKEKAAIAKGFADSKPCDGTGLKFIGASKKCADVAKVCPDFGVQ